MELTSFREGIPGSFFIDGAGARFMPCRKPSPDILERLEGKTARCNGNPGEL